MQVGPGAEVGFWARVRVAVPGADELAVVAAIDAVAHERPELFRDGAVVLYGEVGDATTAVHHIGGDDGPGRADVDAGHALAALLLLHRGIQGQRQADEELPEEEEGAGGFVEQQ